MAQNATLEGLRNQIVKSLFGRNIGLTFGQSTETNPEYLGGVKGYRVPVTGFSSGGSTVTSTSVASDISPTGFTAIGATGASATTAYTLAAPVPGTEKILFNPTTGQAVVLTTGAGAFVCSSGSITSTFGTITMAPKGSFVRLAAASTALWVVVGDARISTGGSAVTYV
jgi:hypothetical protein